MIINTIEKYSFEEKYYISSEIECEVTSLKKKIFFSVQNEFREYLVDEVADSFLLACMLPALVSKQDIKIKGAISDNLKYHFDTIIFLLGKVFNYKPISLNVDEVLDIKFDSKACATGFSGGGRFISNLYKSY